MRGGWLEARAGLSDLMATVALVAPPFNARQAVVVVLHPCKFERQMRLDQVSDHLVQIVPIEFAVLVVVSHSQQLGVLLLTGGWSVHQCAHASAHFSRVSAAPWYALNVNCRSSLSLKHPRLGCRLHGGAAAGAAGTVGLRGATPCTEPVSSGLSSQQQHLKLEQNPFYCSRRPGLRVDGVRTEQRAAARGSLCRKASQAPLLSIPPLALHDLHRQYARARAWHPRRGSGISRHHHGCCGRQAAVAVRSTRCAPAWP